MFRRLRSLFARRRYRDATYARPDLSRRTSASVFERVLRAARGREVLVYDANEVRFAKFVRFGLAWLLMIFTLWFVIRSLLALNIFAG